MKRTLFILLLCVLAGCNPAAKFDVVGVEVPSLNGLSSLHGRATVANSGAKELVIESANIVVRYRDRELGAARLMLPVVIPAEATNTVRYDLALDGVTLASLQTLSSRILSNPGAFTLDLTTWIRWGGMRKKIVMKDVEATQFMAVFL